MINKLIILLLLVLVSSCSSNRDIIVEDRANAINQAQKAKQLEQQRLIEKIKLEQALKNKVEANLIKNRQYQVNAKTQEGFIDIDNQINSESLPISDSEEEDLLLRENKKKYSKNRVLQQNNNTLVFIFYFAYDSVNLDEKTIAEITIHAKKMQSDKTLKLRLEGHTDERGSRGYNLALGENRALAIKDVIALYDVQDRIEVISYGEEKPKSNKHNANAWKENRRVELIFY